MESNGLTLSDIAALGSRDGFGGGGSWIAILFLFVLLAGNGGGWGFNNAIGYNNLATQNDVQRGFDNQNSMGNQREILTAVTNGTAQSVAATNQTFHDTLTVLNDKYNELARDVYSVSNMVQAGIANQNQCCCDTKMLIQETTAQNRYDALLNTNAIIANNNAQSQKVLDALAQNKIDAMQNRINQLELQQAVAGVVRYPQGWTYNAGTSPFCGGCGCGMA